MSDASSDILCDGCHSGLSEPPNEIVICDVCNHGWHQRCHRPRIGVDILAPNVPWQCRLCEFALGTKEAGGSPAKSLSPRITAAAAVDTEDIAIDRNVLPYDLNTLKWDDLHRCNKQNVYCYCGGLGDFNSKMLQCSKCLQWYHEGNQILFQYYVTKIYLYHIIRLPGMLGNTIALW